jgi:hypothetical protein
MQSATKLEEPQLAALERKEEHLRCIALRVWRSWSWRSRSWQRWGGAPPLQPCARQLRSPFSSHCYLFSFFLVIVIFSGCCLLFGPCTCRTR